MLIRVLREIKVIGYRYIPIKRIYFKELVYVIVGNDESEIYRAIWGLRIFTL